MLPTIFKTTALMALCSTLAVAAPVAENTLITRASAPSCTDTDFKNAALEQLNHHRKVHGSPDLVYDETLAKYAQGVSDTCVMKHSGGPYGENLWSMSPGITGRYTDATKDAIYDWAKEIWDYDFSNPGFGMGTGHATALLWRSTKKVGCAWTACSGSVMFTCNFDDTVPNMEGDFQNNVFKYGTKVPSSY